MLNNILQKLLKDKLTLGLIAAAIVLIIGGVFAFQRFALPKAADLPIEEVELTFDAEGPYALLLPRRDGHAIDLTVQRVASYDSFSYEIVYSSEGIDRGAGDLNTFIPLKDSNEYKQEILFGTCSRGNTSDPLHCVFDKEVENGTLTLKFKEKPQQGAKSVKVYRMLTAWHLQQPDIALGVLTSGDGHFIYKTSASREDLVRTGWTIINDVSGAPKLPNDKQVLGKVYALNVPTARTLPAGDVTIEMAEDAPQGAQIARYNESKNSWDLIQTNVSGSRLTGKAEGAGVFAVLVPKQGS